jgi:hypothetical protein
MTAFGNFAPFNQGSAENQSGNLPADIGLDGKANSLLVEHALFCSPASFIKPSVISDLPGAGYGGGARARLDLDNAILKNFELRQQPTGPMPIETASATNLPAYQGGQTLRSILPPTGIGTRAADATISSRPADLIDALSGTRTNLEARATAPLPANPFAPATQSRADFNTPSFSPAAKADTGPLQAVARVEAPRVTAASTQAFDVSSHPLFANISKDAKTAPAYNFNARMGSTAAIEALSRQIMPPDFSAPRGWPATNQTAGKSADPFMAAHCDQSMVFHPNGTVTTTTTLPDGSASKIEAVNLDRSRSVALTDHLGRPTVEQRFDKTGLLVSQTTSRFDNPSAPLVASHKTVQTATQTIETAMDDSGRVIGSKILNYSDLNANKSIA